MGKGGTATAFAPPPAEFHKAKTALRGAFPGLEYDLHEVTFPPKVAKSLAGMTWP